MEIDRLKVDFDHYVTDESRIMVKNHILLYKAISKIKSDENGGTVYIAIPDEAVRTGEGAFFDENGNRFSFKETNFKRFIDGKLPDWLNKMRVVSVKDIHDTDEIGEFIGRKRRESLWLKDSEIEVQLKNNREREPKDFLTFLKELRSNSAKQKSPDQIVREQLLRGMDFIDGSAAYNEIGLKCPRCGHGYVAHNLFDSGYPFIDSEEEFLGQIPLTETIGKSSLYKYYCLNCGAYFGVKHDSKIIFSYERGAYFGGLLEYKIREFDNYFMLESCSCNDFANMRDYRFRFPKYAIWPLIKACLPVRKWKKEYKCGEKIDDGYGWAIHLEYKDICIDSSGYEKFPLNYSRVTGRLQRSIESLCKIYAVDYTEDGLEKRLRL